MAVPRAHAGPTAMKMIVVVCLIAVGCSGAGRGEERGSTVGSSVSVDPAGGIARTTLPGSHRPPDADLDLPVAVSEHLGPALGGDGKYASVASLREAGALDMESAAHALPKHTVPVAATTAGSGPVRGEGVPPLLATLPAVGFGSGFLHQPPKRVVAAALALGHRFILTAAYYGTGNEVGTGIALAEALADPQGPSREDLVVSSKVHPASYRGGEAFVERTVRESMARLGLERLDVLMLHGRQCSQEHTDPGLAAMLGDSHMNENCDAFGEEVRRGTGDFRSAWAAMQRLRRLGRVTYLGASHFRDLPSLNELWDRAPEWAVDASDPASVAAARPSVLSVHWTLYDQAPQLRAWAAERGVTVLAHGLFGWEYAAPCECTDGHAVYCDGTVAAFDPAQASAPTAAAAQAGAEGRRRCEFGKEHPAHAPVLNDPILTRVAARHGMSPARALIRFAMQEGVLPVYTATSTAHMLDNWAAVAPESELDGDGVVALRALHGTRGFGARGDLTELPGYGESRSPRGDSGGSRHRGRGEGGGGGGSGSDRGPRDRSRRGQRRKRRRRRRDRPRAHDRSGDRGQR